MLFVVAKVVRSGVVVVKAVVERVVGVVEKVIVVGVVEVVGGWHGGEGGCGWRCGGGWWLA